MSLANWPQLKRRVVVTGMGAISPLGNTLADTWTALLSGRSGAGPITLFDSSDFTVRFACEVKGFDPNPYVPAKEQKKMDRFMHFGISAAMMAWKDAGFVGRTDENNIDPNRVGAYVSSGMGGLPILEETVKLIAEKGPRRISPFFIPSVIPNLTSGHLSIMLNARAHNACIVSACASGAHSVGESAVLISRGDADVMIAGGCEAVISILGVGGFAAMKALSTRNDAPEKASRPFDRDRDGFVVGEGAGVLILEDYEHARKRGARIYAEVAGYASNSDANHMTAPCEDGRGAGECMELALSRAQIDPRKIDYINAHGTSTPMGDVAESLAVERLFGAHAHELVMTSTKSMTGHLLGGAGGLESCVAIKVLETGDIPPTINLDNPDEKCRLNYARGEAIRKDCDTVMNNSFGFGGTNASLVFSRV